MDAGAYTSEAGSWSDRHPAGCGRRKAGHGGRLRSWGQGEITSYGGIDIRLAHRLPGKLAEGHAPHCSFDKLSGGDALI